MRLEYGVAQVLNIRRTFNVYGEQILNRLAPDAASSI